MVVFTCNHCGESVHKPRVEKHYSMQCRRPKSLTCVDCFKDFRDEEYSVHTKCFTEEERYAAKGTFQGAIVKKGDAKQESWTEMIRSIVQNESNMSPSVRNLINTISTYTNIPRKKPKFINFLKSSLGGRVYNNDIEAAWDLIEKYKSEMASATQQNGTKDKSENGTKKEIGTNGNEAKPKKQKNDGSKHKLENGDKLDDTEPKVKKTKNEEVETADKFSFKETILEILNSKNSISSKKLQKKVLNRYLQETGNSEITEKTIKKYNKKLKKIPNVSISNDTISLLTNVEQ